MGKYRKHITIKRASVEIKPIRFRSECFFFFFCTHSPRYSDKAVHARQVGMNLSATPCQAQHDLHQTCTPADDD